LQVCDLSIDSLERCGFKHNSDEMGWKITVLETGLESQTGGCIAICMKTIPNEQVIATYGDGLANVSISQLLKYHDLKKNCNSHCGTPTRSIWSFRY
jgi:glucose-1-phosphate cytidylyltransferase